MIVGPGGADRLAVGYALVAAQVFHDHNVANCERRCEELLAPSSEAHAVYRSVENARSVDPVVAERGREGQRTPMPEQCASDELVPTRRPASDRLHGDLSPSFVNEGDAPRSSRP